MSLWEGYFSSPTNSPARLGVEKTANYKQGDGNFALPQILINCLQFLLHYISWSVTHQLGTGQSQKEIPSKINEMLSWGGWCPLPRWNKETSSYHHLGIFFGVIQPSGFIIQAAWDNADLSHSVTNSQCDSDRGQYRTSHAFVFSRPVEQVFIYFRRNLFKLWQSKSIIVGFLSFPHLEAGLDHTQWWCMERKERDLQEVKWLPPLSEVKQSHLMHCSSQHLR